MQLLSLCRRPISMRKGGGTSTLHSTIATIPCSGLVWSSLQCLNTNCTPSGVCSMQGLHWGRNCIWCEQLLTLLPLKAAGTRIRLKLHTFTTLPHRELYKSTHTCQDKCRHIQTGSWKREHFKMHLNQSKCHSGVFVVENLAWTQFEHQRHGETQNTHHQQCEQHQLSTYFSFQRGGHLK